MSVNSAGNLLEQCAANGVSLPYSDSLSILTAPLHVGNLKLPNRMACQPMEGADGNADGSPGELTTRRYRRFAQGGSGLIWMEAIAVVEEGRANPRHLWLHEGNVDSFKALIDMMRRAAWDTCGHDITIIAQLTHAGRYSKPTGIPAPVIACNNPYYEKEKPIDQARIISDEALNRLENEFEKAAVLAHQAGFDGVDIKACHRYIIGELLSAFMREGAYGGPFENRTAFLRNCVNRARAACPSGFMVTSRMNIYDGVPNPYGWGQCSSDYLQTDLTEPLRLIGELHASGMELIDLTMGNPYVNPHVNRPYKRGGYAPPENPLKGVERMTNGIGVIQRAYPNLAIVGSGLSYLGFEAGNVAAGIVEQGMASIAGFGRMALAYPDFARDIAIHGAMQKAKSCLACTKCTELMRAGTTTGCPVRDQEVYLPLYKKHCLHRE